MNRGEMQRALGDRLAVLRGQAGLSQSELAASFGVSRNTLANWEAGKTSPDAIELLRLCRALHATPHELLGWEG